TAACENGAPLGHETIRPGEVISPRAAHAPDMPGVEQLGLGCRYEQVALFWLTVLKPELAVLKDLGAGCQPSGMPATRAESLAAGDPIPAWDHDRLCRRKGRVRHDAARRVDPDQASDVARHSRRVGCEARALIDNPAGAGVGFADFFEHLDVGG